MECGCKVGVCDSDTGHDTYYRVEHCKFHASAERVIKRLEAKLVRMQRVCDAASYCFRHGFIDKGAVLFTMLNKKLEALYPKGKKNG